MQRDFSAGAELPQQNAIFSGLCGLHSGVCGGVAWVRSARTVYMGSLEVWGGEGRGHTSALTICGLHTDMWGGGERTHMCPDFVDCAQGLICPPTTTHQLMFAPPRTSTQGLICAPQLRGSCGLFICLPWAATLFSGPAGPPVCLCLPACSSRSHVPVPPCLPAGS